MKLHLLGESDESLAAWLRAKRQPAFRSRQLVQWLHTKRVASVEAMTNLPASLRTELAASFRLRTLEVEAHRTAPDGLTEKWLFQTGHGDAVETVLIRDRKRSRRTVCVSCMVGCPVGCVFCATGQCGFGRNLEAGEILEQVYVVDRHLRESGAGVSHVVFMGMGEPLLNYDAVFSAVRALCDPARMNLANRHVTISTIGVVPGIERMVEDGVRARLALSLHAADQETRVRLIPSAARWPLSALLPAVEAYARTQAKGVTFEYCLLHRVNDRSRDADALSALLRGIRGKVNLIPYNAAPGSSFAPPPPDRIRAFQTRLERGGLSVTLRQEKGAGIDAACGQLRGAHMPRPPTPPG